MIFSDMPESEYHSRKELSSTGARRLLDSPARFRYWEDHPQPHKAVFDLGTAAHTKILGVGASTVVYPVEHLTPSGNVSTSKATVAWVEEQRAAGLLPITASDARKVDRMAEAVLAEPEARQILERIVGREVTIVQEIDGVPVRARFDLYDGHRAADLKTTRDASPRAFNRSIGSYGYHVQQQWYDEAHKAETGGYLEGFTFVVVESAPPHLVGVYEIDFVWAELGSNAAKKARGLFRECTESGVWPGYGAATLTAPTWAVFEGEEEEITL